MAIRVMEERMIHVDKLETVIIKGHQALARKPEVESLESVQLARANVLLVGDALFMRHLLPDLLLLRVLFGE